MHVARICERISAISKIFRFNGRANEVLQQPDTAYEIFLRWFTKDKHIPTDLSKELGIDVWSSIVI